jgi:endonuclease/exonuclease/phosphatase family metal-dependent hydrolase
VSAAVDVRVLSYNIFVRPPGINANGNDYKDERLNHFVSLIDRFDVICLQELFGAFSSRRAHFIAAAKAKGFLYAVHSPHVGWLSGFLVDGGLCIVSKFPIVADHHVTFPKGLFSDALSAKGALHALIDVTPPPPPAPAAAAASTSSKLLLHVFCTHLQASYYPSRPLDDVGFVKSWQARIKQLAVLNAFVNQCIAGDDHDAVLVGDFNVNGRQYTHGSAEHELHDAKFAGFAGAPKVEVADDHAFLVSDQYVDLLKLLASPAYDVFDCLRDAAESIGLHCHPVTIGDVVMHGEKAEAREVLLTDAHDLRSRHCLDYIFLLWRSNAAGGTHADVHADVHPHTHVERFAVVENGLVVTQLSDHYGVSAHLRVAPRVVHHHKHHRRPSRRTITASESASSSSLKKSKSKSKVVDTADAAAPAAVAAAPAAAAAAAPAPRKHRSKHKSSTAAAESARTESSE